ncbi:MULTISPECIES: phospholipase [unclassified Microbacterium]|uniref:aggregation-promoting factor C-terminal-like domain-containing protein n=1 Tax=unclassified Microbacterium TaxID=2609290 RepID=UPI00214BFAD8|nr:MULTISPECIES: phospholipase [unclassified Microbacterium]MCR2810890.1 phospholipase [Microbacterium sp. zg.B185]WIM19707.1 phospholipase [Microbacterium sp. zg-B185]
MLHPKQVRRARRPLLTPRATALGVALALVAGAGITTALPAAALTPAVAAVAPEGAAAETLREISTDAHGTLGAARAVLATTGTVTADIAASGLDLGVDSTIINTAALRADIDRLSALNIVPALMLPGLTAETAAETREVRAEVSELRDRLEAAQAQKAAEEAAAAAAAAAQRAAEEAAAEAQRQAEAAAAALAAANTPDGAKVIAQQMASATYGWGGDQFSCLVSLWDKESGWNYQAYNDSSGATGIPQSLPGSKMASAGSDWQTNAVTQIAWGLGYIDAVYGSPCSAWGHSQSTDWY